MHSVIDRDCLTRRAKHVRRLLTEIQQNVTDNIPVQIVAKVATPKEQVTPVSVMSFLSIPLSW